MTDLRKAPESKNVVDLTESSARAESRFRLNQLMDQLVFGQEKKSYQDEWDRAEAKDYPIQPMDRRWIEGTMTNPMAVPQDDRRSLPDKQSPYRRESIINMLLNLSRMLPDRSNWER